MTPGARTQAAIELLAAILSSVRPADGTASAYFRERRYIGAKDRRAVAERVWGALRRRARLSWWVSHAVARALNERGGRPPDARRMILADLVLSDGWTIERLVRLTEDNHGPAGLSQDDRDVLATMLGQSLDHSSMPRAVRGEYPEWLEPALRRRFGEDMERELAALTTAAPLDLRVNTLKATREEAKDALVALGLNVVETPLSPLGLRLGTRVDLAAQEVFRDGRVEVQDEGSQVVALLTGARPGQAVVDYCAGAGGKTLALAAAMGNRGRLVALDVSVGRIDRSAVRLKRAGVHNVTRRVLEGDNDRWLKRAAGQYDRVLVDVPCTGTGTWRRNPDARWRLDPADVAELVERQARILAAAARLVKPGGRLVYATCSILHEENEDQIRRFLDDRPDFHPLPLAEAWSDAVGAPWPGADGDALTLSPARNGTDGYFAAVLARDGSQ
ncbi:MAG: RsmB/NOP family class I SAM-dependent RNA methyltransferase [Alphaproteobacteria bacterium]